MKRICLLLLWFLPSILHAKDFTHLLQDKSVRPGFCVVVGCEQANDLARARLGGKFLVQGLCGDVKTKSMVRKTLLASGDFGPVSVGVAEGQNLPYADNVVNAIVVINQRNIDRDEIMRVVAPYGVALFHTNGSWQKVVKPYPQQMDEWSQPEHSASRSTVSKDLLVGPPTRLKWLDQEKHDRENLIQLLSAGGRNFYIFSNGTIVARDAFNGIRLWEQSNTGQVWAATKDYVCTTIGGKLATIDAASGETSKTDVRISRFCAWEEGVVYTANSAYSIESKKFLWQNPEPTATDGAPLVMNGKLVIATSPRRPNPEFICRDAKTGKDLWRVPSLGKLAFSYRGKLFIEGEHKEETVTVRNRERKTQIAVNHCLDLKDGQRVWTIEYYLPGHHGSSTMFCLGDKVWVRPGKLGSSTGRDEFWRSYDLKTGEKLKEIPAIQSMHRCYEPRATERFLLASGIDFLDLHSDEVYSFRGARGDCHLGTTPANGMLYQFPNMCMCMGQVNGVSGVASHSLSDPAESSLKLSDKLEKGPAYGKAIRPRKKPTSSGEDQKNWLSLRGDNSRRGANQAEIPGQLEVLWEKQGKLRASSPVANGGDVYVALRDVNAVAAFNVAEGKHHWTFRADGPIDSPPTLAGDKIVFGAEDGWIYVVRAADGKLAWRFQAAPQQRVILTNGRPASAWPLHGSLVVEDGIVYAAAGHHNELDGGLFMYAMELETGKIVWKKRLVKEGITQKIPMSEQGHTGNNILASDGKTLFMEMLHLEIKTGKIAKTYHNGKVFFSGGLPEAVVWGGPQGYLLDLSLPAYTSGHSSSNWIWGKIRANMVAVQDQLAYGIITLHGKDQNRYKDKPLFEHGSTVVFCAKQSEAKKSWSEYIPQESLVWKHALPQGSVARTVIKTADQVIVACQTMNSEAQAAGLVLQINPASGKEIGRLELSSAPQWDGLAAAQDRLFLVTEDHKLLCLGSARN